MQAHTGRLNLAKSVLENSGAVKRGPTTVHPLSVLKPKRCQNMHFQMGNSFQFVEMTIVCQTQSTTWCRERDPEREREYSPSASSNWSSERDRLLNMNRSQILLSRIRCPRKNATKMSNNYEEHTTRVGAKAVVSLATLSRSVLLTWFVVFSFLIHGLMHVDHFESWERELPWSC